MYNFKTILAHIPELAEMSLVNQFRGRYAIFKIEFLHLINQFVILKEVIIYLRLSFSVSDLQLDDISKMSDLDSVYIITIIKCDSQDIISIPFP